MLRVPGGNPCELNGGSPGIQIRFMHVLEWLRARKVAAKPSVHLEIVLEDGLDDLSEVERTSLGEVANYDIAFKTPSKTCQ